MVQFVEGTTTSSTFNFTNQAGAPLVPVSVVYTVTDQASGTVIVPPASVPPASSVTITVTSAQNALVARLRETHVMEVTATDGTGNKLPALTCWDLVSATLGCGC